MKINKLIHLLLTLGVVNGDAIQVWQYKDYSLPDIKFTCSNYHIDGLSKSCTEQLDVVCQNESLLFTLLDASSKFPYSGLGYASKMDFGNFDQCLTVDHTYEGGKILGEYCVLGLILPDVFNIDANASDTIDINSVYKLSVCRPNGCTAKDLNAIITNVTNMNLPLFNDLGCQNVDTNKDYTAADIITIIIISVCILLMVVSSIYDFYLHRSKLECSNDIYLAFSVITNGKKLLHVGKQSKEQIHTFQGLRVISMMWVIAGHSISIWNYIGVENLPEVTEWQTKLSSVYIYAAPLAVDTFFFISGFLLAYQYLKQKPKPFMDHVKTVPSMYLHRYLRLTPAMAMVYLITISLMKHIGSGPLWPVSTERESSVCKEQWWSFFLYIQNYYNYDFQNMCLVVTWYLCADMQMFILSPLVIIPIAVLLQRSQGFKLSMAKLFILNLLFIVLPLAIKLIFRDYENTIDTHSRLIDYFIGVMLGVFMRVNQDKSFLYMINNSWKSMVNLVTWIVILLGMFAVFMCLREIPQHHGYETNAIFTSLMRPAWCIGLSWIVYSCHLGYGGIVNWILSRPIFQIWGRFTYCMYLLHMQVIYLYLGSLRTRFYFSDYSAFYVFCGHFVVTLLLSIFWTLAFESPLITIEKVILGRQGNKRKIVPESHGESTENEDKGNEK